MVSSGYPELRPFAHDVDDIFSTKPLSDIPQDYGIGLRYVFIRVLHRVERQRLVRAQTVDGLFIEKASMMQSGLVIDDLVDCVVLVWVLHINQGDQRVGRACQEERRLRGVEFKLSDCVCMAL